MRSSLLRTVLLAAGGLGLSGMFGRREEVALAVPSGDWDPKRMLPHDPGHVVVVNDSVLTVEAPRKQEYPIERRGMDCTIFGGPVSIARSRDRREWRDPEIAAIDAKIARAREEAEQERIAKAAAKRARWEARKTK